MAKKKTANTNVSGPKYLQFKARDAVFIFLVATGCFPSWSLEIDEGDRVLVTIKRVLRIESSVANREVDVTLSEALALHLNDKGSKKLEKSR